MIFLNSGIIGIPGYFSVSLDSTFLTFLAMGRISRGSQGADALLLVLSCVCSAICVGAEALPGDRRSLGARWRALGSQAPPPGGALWPWTVRPEEKGWALGRPWTVRPEERRAGHPGRPWTVRPEEEVGLWGRGAGSRCYRPHS